MIVKQTGVAVFLLSTLAFGSAQAAPKLSWAGCGISKNAFMTEMAAAYKKKTGIEIDLQGGGATKGIREVASGSADMGGTCRHLLENQQTMSTVPEERRVQLTPVAWDALVVIVHKDNPVKNITLDEIRALYTGKITNWKQLGGHNAPVELYVRKGKISGVGRTKRELIFNNYDQEFVATHVVEESANLERDIVTNPNGVGITGVSSARKIANIAKILTLEGKEPSYEHIKSGDYLLYRPLYMVSHLQASNPEVARFRNFVMGPEGTQVMRNVGTVPYEDAIHLWLKYLDQQERAITDMHARKAAKAKRAPAGESRSGAKAP